MEKLLDYVLIDHHKLDEKRIAYKFPLTSAEILSASNSRIFEFFSSENENGQLSAFERLFSFIMDDGKIATKTVNFTRAGYVTKIITNLITSKPQIFADYFFKKIIFIDALIKHSYCKSISMLLLSLLSLSHHDASTSNINVTDISPNASNPSASWLKDVLEIRLSIFRKITEEAIIVSGLKDHIDSSTNLCNLIISILSKEQPEKEEFVRTFVNTYLDKIVDLFVEGYSNGINNRLGNVFLVVLDILIKDNEKFKYINSTKFTGYFKKYAQLIVEPAKVSKTMRGNRKIISTFAAEMEKTNINIYKVLEALFMLLKYLVNTNKDQIIIDTNLHQQIFSYYAKYPFNNVLHNQIQKILTFLIDISNKKLLSVFFIENSSFYDLLSHVLSETKNTDSMRKTRKGYFGHVKALANGLMVYETKTETAITSNLTR